MLDKRTSGILLHITSLPSPYGIGDLGEEAYQFANFLKSSGQTYWQILPLNPTRLESGNSPYSSPSAFAGNTLLISPELLYKEGYLTKNDIEYFTEKKADAVDFVEVTALKKKLFNKAFQQFKQSGTDAEYEKFCGESFWLDDYALFLAIKEHLKLKTWALWPEGLKNRNQNDLNNAREKLADAVGEEKFLQFIFNKQWTALRTYCNKLGIKILGDLPFYVGHESADVWTFPQFFRLDERKNPTLVAGVPPDYFSATGQLWGNPIFHWENLRNDGFWWWMKRIEQNLQTVDLLRIDHFRAFSAYWEVPAGEKTAKNGKWVPTPGYELFNKIKEAFPKMPFIAEDLGEIDEPVYQLRDKYDLPGMRLLLYAFNSSMSENSFLPHNHVPNCVVYTGTHDNISVRGWFDTLATAQEKRWLESYVGQEIAVDNVHDVMNRLAWMSTARLAVLPMQDILGLGAESIMNKPSTASGNWQWRVNKGLVTKAVADKLQHLMKVYGRYSEQ